MQNQLFPKEIIENTQEENFSKHSIKSRVIYSVIVLSLITLLCALPWIEVDVGIRSQGLIRPVTELVQLSAPASGRLELLNASENSFIKNGEIFAILEAAHLKEQIRFNKARENQLVSFLNDLKILQSTNSSNLITSVQVTSPRYLRSYPEFRQQLLNQKQEVDKMNRSLTREKVLFERNANSAVDLDEVDFAHKAALNQFKLLIEQQQNRWRLDEISFQNELDELRSENVRFKQELSRYEIRAPISGTVQNVAGIFQNSFVYANQVLGEISPDTSLVAEVYVSPGDIGMLREGMPVRFQIDAYNYNQWGIIDGSIQSISTDILMDESQPLFRIRCSLDKTYLKLTNGFKGEIKKGMTFQARFIVSRRSLLQLLYDKADDWLNPARSENEFAVKPGN